MLAVGWIAYLVIQILFIPVLIVGMIVLLIRQLLVSKSLGVSATAVSVIGMRWTMDVFGIRSDAAARRLYPALPNGSAFGLWSLYFPFFVQYRLSGVCPPFVAPERRGYEAPFKVAMARTLLFDRLLQKWQGRVDQFVIMGAGYDTRCYAGPMAAVARRFELDQANTLRFKRDCLKKAGIDAAGVVFAPVDFKSERAGEAHGGGFDLRKVAVVVGGRELLPPSEVRGTLREIKALCCPGSALLADVYALRMLKLKGVAMTGEPFKFMLDFQGEPERVLREFFQSEGLALGEAEWMGHLSPEGAFGVVAEALA